MGSLLLMGSGGKGAGVPASLTVRDAKTLTAAGTGDISLTTMGLTFSAGDILFLCGFAVRTGNADCVISSGAATGWTGFEAQYMAAGTGVGGCRHLWLPSAVGTEDAVNVFDHAGTGVTGDRFSVFAASLICVGTPSIGGNPSRSISNSNPAAQTIDSGGVAGPVFAWSAACNGSGPTDPNQSFATETPLHNLTTTATASASLAARYMTRLWAQGETANNIVTDFADLGNQNGLMSGFIQVAAP